VPFDTSASADEDGQPDLLQIAHIPRTDQRPADNSSAASATKPACNVTRTSG